MTKKYRKKYSNKPKREVLKVEDIVAKLAEETDEQKRSETVLNFLSTMGRFHRYSLNNQILIAVQKPDATMVAGFQKWKSLGRSVKKGEKGIQILMPIMLKDKNVDVKERVEDAELEEKETQQRPRIWFKPTYVFDISQTEGKPLPEIRSEILGDYKELTDKLIDACRKKGIEVEIKKLGHGHYGTSYGGKIELAEEQSQGEMFSTLVHEVAHELLHKEKERADRSREAHRRKEIQAEGVAYVVCSALGIPNNFNAARYLAVKGASAKDIRDNLNAISIGSKMILEMIDYPVNKLDRYEQAPTQNAEATTRAARRIQEVFDSAGGDVQYSSQVLDGSAEPVVTQEELFPVDDTSKPRKPSLYH